MVSVQEGLPGVIGHAGEVQLDAMGIDDLNARMRRIHLHQRIHPPSPDGGDEIAQRAAIIDVPHGNGHVLLFSTNPFWRGQTKGSYFLVFNAIMNWNDLDAGKAATGTTPATVPNGR